MEGASAAETKTPKIEVEFRISGLPADDSTTVMPDERKGLGELTLQHDADDQASRGRQLNASLTSGGSGLDSESPALDGTAFTTHGSMPVHR